MDNELKHYGVKGMKWGVRKEKWASMDRFDRKMQKKTYKRQRRDHQAEQIIKYHGNSVAKAKTMEGIKSVGKTAAGGFMAKFGTIAFAEMATSLTAEGTLTALYIAGGKTAVATMLGITGAAGAAAVVGAGLATAGVVKGIRRQRDLTRNRNQKRK